MYHSFRFKFYGHQLWQQCLDFRESVVKRLAWNCFILWYGLDKIDFLAYPWLPSKLWWGGIIAVTVNIVPSPYWAIHYYILPIFLARLLYLGVKINYLVYGALWKESIHATFCKNHYYFHWNFLPHSSRQCD